jgi:hypothetical protein
MLSLVVLRASEEWAMESLSWSGVVGGLRSGIEVSYRGAGTGGGGYPWVGLKLMLESCVSSRFYVGDDRGGLTILVI